METFTFYSCFTITRSKLYEATPVGHCKEAVFIVLVGKTESTVSIRLANPVGNETYKISVRSAELDFQVICTSKQAVISFPGVTGMFYYAACEVTCPIPRPTIYPPRDAVLTELLEHCKKNPDLMMTFNVRNEQVKAVTSIMTSRSPVIDAMMKMNCIEAETRTVKIVDFSKAVITKMVEFCETNQIKETKGFELELYKVADKYDIQPMKECASILAIDTICRQNVIELFQLARIYPFEKLEEACLKFCFEHWADVNESANVAAVDDEALKDFWLAMKMYRLSQNVDKLSIQRFGI